MKLKTLLSTSLVSATFLISSCGGGSGSSSDLDNLNDDAFDPLDGTTTSTDVPNTDAAPFTLDNTKFKISSQDDFAFYFNKTSGDASAGGESGYCPAFVVSSDSLTLEFSSGFSRSYDLPEFVSDVTYTYVRNSTQSGTLTLIGSGVGDGGTAGGVNNANDMDIFVTTNDGRPFNVKIDLVFSTNGVIMNSLNANTTINQGTSDDSQVPLNFTTTTTQDGANLELQSGGDVPAGYTTAIAATQSTVNPGNLFPDRISTTNEIEFRFNSTTTPGTAYDGVAKYVINGFLPSDQGFTGVNDQGLAVLERVASSSTQTISEPVVYSWSTNSTSTNVGVLTLAITENGTVTNESYILDFNTNVSGNFNQTQPAPAVFGTFTLPFLVNSN